ncbi:hypothetical protein GCM10010297_03620 [Streptomyces malachitofuscus]|nr:hypothetical protein GCM10010297_03620 [Streptomyces malachitofuscus]
MTADVQIRLLGSVELRAHGKIVRTELGRVRRLLALLAWQPNEFVSDHEAIQQVWDDKTPRHPRDALYTCATRLRHVFAEVGDTSGRGNTVVVRRRGGYLLAFPADSIDLHRFRRLVQQAREAVRQSDLVDARQLFDRALMLWEGAPLADLGSGWAERARTSLEQERLTVLTGSADIGLRLGGFPGDIPVLYRLADEHPLNEEVAGLLMLALYRSGRESEALTCYARMRSRTIEYLGDEPGAALRRIQQAVLRRDRLPREAPFDSWLPIAA